MNDTEQKEMDNIKKLYGEAFCITGLALDEWLQYIDKLNKEDIQGIISDMKRYKARSQSMRNSGYRGRYKFRDIYDFSKFEEIIKEFENLI